MAKRLIVALAAGFVAVFLIQQPLLTLLHALNIGPAAYAMQRVRPFGIPSVIWQASVFGVIGALFLMIADRKHGEKFWNACLGGAFGYFLPGFLNWILVGPIEHHQWMPSLLLDSVPNLAWGFGTALIYRVFVPRQEPTT